MNLFQNEKFNSPNEKLVVEIELKDSLQIQTDEAVHCTSQLRNLKGGTLCTGEMTQTLT